MTAAEKLKTATGSAPLDVERLRKDFPALQQEVHGKPLAYLDNAASSQKPRAVIEAVRDYYERDHSNVHRGVHYLSQRATDAYEQAREKIRAWLNAASVKEIIYTRGATEAINLVAHSHALPLLGPGDEILITEMEHHANIVPWQMVRDTTGAALRVASMNDRGELILEEFESLLGPQTRMVAFTQISNALGTINPVGRMVALVREKAPKATILIDGAQAVQHARVDVAALDCDFYVFSGHKVFGPTGIGVLYGREELLNAMPPYQGGGDMIDRVTFEETTWADLPYKFEAGTPHIAGAVGLGAAFDYLEAIGMERIAAYEQELLEYGTRRLEEIEGLRIVGTAREKTSVLSFVVDGIHPHDLGTILDMRGIAVRVGHHCAQPVMQHFGIPATTRASLAFTNTRGELDRLAEAVKKAVAMFHG